MNKLIFTIPLFIAAISISACENDSSGKTNSKPIPDPAYLDSISELNSDLLYYWTEETARNEKNIVNNKDLNIKIDRKVLLNFKGEGYFLYPFFKKNSSNTQILFLHFLLTRKDLNRYKLKDISFKDLVIIDHNKAYYYYE